MTTILGLKTQTGIEAVVIGSDTQVTYFDEDGTPTGKKKIVKVICGKNWVLGHAGKDDARLFYFNRMMLGKSKAGNESSEEKTSDKKITPDQRISMAIDTYMKYGDKFDGPHFPEVNTLNTRVYRKIDESEDEKSRKEEFDSLHCFILVSNQPQVGLWRVDEYGSLKPPAKDDETESLEYVVIGSGSKIVRKYIKDQIEDEKINPMEVDIPKALDLVRNCIDKAASKDIYTGMPIDLVVLTPFDLKFPGERIHEASLRAGAEEFRRVMEEYNKPPYITEIASP